MQTSDSLKFTDKDLAYSLMLKYYNEGLKPVIDTTSAVGTYKMDNGVYTNTTIDDMLSQLNSGVAYSQVNISCNSSRTVFVLSTIQPAPSGNYIFGFTGRSY
jgi:hypothetical protein